MQKVFNFGQQQFYVDKLISQGGFGYVYQVSDQQGNKFAVKQINI